MACRAFSKYDFRCNTKVDCVLNNSGSLVMLCIFLHQIFEGYLLRPKEEKNKVVSGCIGVK